MFNGFLIALPEMLINCKVSEKLGQKDDQKRTETVNQIKIYLPYDQVLHI